jgi:alanine transaminase
MEVHGFDKETFAQILKVAASQLSSNTVGQIACGLLVKPPKTGDPSFALYEREMSEVWSSLKRRAAHLTEKLNDLSQMKGFSCQPIEGAMYAFPKIELPEKLVKQAEAQGVAPDELYCMDLVESTGICCVPGSGFGQVEGTFHLRMTILPPEEDVNDILQKLATFHTQFLNKHSTTS